MTDSASLPEPILTKLHDAHYGVYEVTRPQWNRYTHSFRQNQYLPVVASLVMVRMPQCQWSNPDSLWLNWPLINYNKTPQSMKRVHISWVSLMIWYELEYISQRWSTFCICDKFERLILCIWSGPFKLGLEIDGILHECDQKASYRSVVKIFCT